RRCRGVRGYSRSRSASMVVEFCGPVPTFGYGSGRSAAARRRSTPMKYRILIHSKPQPWGHPTSDYTSEYQALPVQQQHDLGARWEKVFGDADAKGEIV